MKKVILVSCVFLLPIILLAANSNFFKLLKGGVLTAPEHRGYRKAQFIVYSKDGADWVQSEKTVYYYSTNSARPDSIKAFEYLEGEYTEYMVCNIQYNAAGRRTQNDYYLIDQTMGRIPMMRMQATYDTQNRLTHVYDYGLDFMTMELELRSRSHYFYANNNITTSYGWASDPWGTGTPGYSKDTYSFDGQGRVIGGISQMSTDSLNWSNTDSYEITYHANDTSNAASNIEMLASIYTMPWVEEGLYYMGMPLVSLSLTWNGTAWEQQMRAVYDWNSANNRLNYMQEESWNGAWIPEYKTIPTYDSNGNITELLYQYSSDRVWEDETKYVFTWQQYTAADDPIAPEIGSLELKTFPQPFAETLHIVTASKVTGEIKLDIYNVKGQLINSLSAVNGNETIWNGQDINGRNAGSGIYFIKATQNGSSKTIRTIKMK